MNFCLFFDGFGCCLFFSDYGLGLTIWIEFEMLLGSFKAKKDIQKLRKKLGRGSGNSIIETVRGIGYRARVEKGK